MNKKVIIDCDPGHDDAMAIVLAASTISNLQIKAITTVAGNVGVEKNTLNALRLCDLLGLDNVPVAKGSAQPLMRNMEIAEHVHGKSGLDGTALPETPVKQVVDQHAVGLIVEKLMESEGDITLVPIGPLTNIALAIRKEPRIVTKIKEIVLMGGGTYGNRNPAAEFNIYADAEAAKIVFECGLPITMFGLDVTHKALATADIVNHIAKINNPVATAVTDMLHFYSRVYLEKLGFAGAAVHDPCTITHLIDPTIFELKKVRVDIETKGEFTYGMTCVDQSGSTVKEPNVNFAYNLDQDKFWGLFINTLNSYSN